VFAISTCENHRAATGDPDYRPKPRDQAQMQTQTPRQQQLLAIKLYFFIFLAKFYHFNFEYRGSLKITFCGILEEFVLINTDLIIICRF